MTFQVARKKLQKMRKLGTNNSQGMNCILYILLSNLKVCLQEVGYDVLTQHYGYY